MLKTLRECGALEHILPEVAALFGVPQITDDPTPVDLGEHLLKALDEAARRHAPLAVRFALLVMNVGKVIRRLSICLCITATSSADARAKSDLRAF